MSLTMISIIEIFFYIVTFLATIFVFMAVIKWRNKNIDQKLSEMPSDKRQQLKFQYWIPGLCLSIGLGIAAYAFIYYSYSGIGMGYSLFFAVPLSIGAIIGYSQKSIRIWWTVGLCLFAIVAVIFVLNGMGVTGIFCGLTLGAIFLLPVLMGVTLGYVLQQSISKRISKKYNSAPFLMFFILPLLCGFVENKTFVPLPINIVQTSVVLDVPAQEIWKKFRFYEEIKGKPPLLLRLGLPIPVSTEGNHKAIGELTKCFYDRGYIIKEITDSKDNELLAFKVVEQSIHFEKDVRLLQGSLQLEPLDEKTTAVTLTTQYQSLIRPQWLWKPMEEKVIGTLHKYVLQNI